MLQSQSSVTAVSQAQAHDTLESQLQTSVSPALQTAAADEARYPTFISPSWDQHQTTGGRSQVNRSRSISPSAKKPAVRRRLNLGTKERPHSANLEQGEYKDFLVKVRPKLGTRVSERPRSVNLEDLESIVSSGSFGCDSMRSAESDPVKRRLKLKSESKERPRSSNLEEVQLEKVTDKEDEPAWQRVRLAAKLKLKERPRSASLASERPETKEEREVEERRAGSESTLQPSFRQAVAEGRQGGGKSLGSSMHVGSLAVEEAGMAWSISFDADDDYGGTSV